MQGQDMFRQREVEGGVLTYDAYQVMRRKLGKHPLIISEAVMNSIHRDRNERRDTVGLNGMYRADMQDFHRLFVILGNVGTDFHRVVSERADALVVRWREMERAGFLTGVREAWKIFLRQQQHPLSVFFLGYRTL